MIRPTRARLTLATAVLAGTGLLAYGGLRGTLTYYRTPAEVRADPEARHATTRLAGAVVPGSVRHEGAQTVFRLAAGGEQITVRQHGAPPETFREGQDAVVEGVLGADGVFRSERLLVRHGNEYRPAGPTPPADRSGAIAGPRAAG
ncbi:cytochrome c maturation protein CcmE [Micromonospora sp. NPDC049559]|uniref:cytochrome c maturation protein CcmE n=1 Tax=Micromonospora sp. NPDC049559 TaxID=3155923 RepID=UPI00341721EB